MESIKPKYETLTMRDGSLIRTAWVDPLSPPKAVIHILHGFAEHINHYLELAYFFAGNGYACVIHDQRGFGEMPGKTKRQRKASQGIVSDYASFLDDIDIIREKIASVYPGIPLILYGHSMGGNIAASYLLKRAQEAYIKVILETPWLRLRKPPSGLLIVAARLLGSISPKFSVIRKIPPEEITRDIKKVEKADALCDEYYHNRISLRLFTQIEDAGVEAIAGAARITAPVLLFIAGKDMLVAEGAIRAFHDNAGKNVVMEDYPDGYHSLHNDIVRDQVLARMLSFCEDV